LPLFSASHFAKKAVYMGPMTDASTGPVAAAITTRLTDALAPTHLEVLNESALHAGHMGDDGTGESHFRVVIESAAFAGRTRVERQRLVNRALADLLAERIHALAISARAPGE
jgi:BolA protein